MTDEIYQSSTHGDIPLSFTGRRLLANLRHVIDPLWALPGGGIEDTETMIARCKSAALDDIAQYIRELETKKRETSDSIGNSTIRGQAKAWLAVYNELNDLPQKEQYEPLSGIGAALRKIRELKEAKKTLVADKDARAAERKRAASDALANAEMRFNLAVSELDVAYRDVQNAGLATDFQFRCAPGNMFGTIAIKP